MNPAVIRKCDQRSERLLTFSRGNDRSIFILWMADEKSPINVFIAKRWLRMVGLDNLLG